ncbi:MAG: CoA pyrophosphatase [Syntrophales bacterium]|nr:CoA pyrophosphatase [Syntrophales bacterium]
MDTQLLNDKELVLKLIRERLGATPVNYARQMAAIRSHNRDGKTLPWKPAGVILPLCFKETDEGFTPQPGGFVFQFIRRSSSVSQGGDISGPGGMLSPRLDRLLRLPLMMGITPILRGLPKTLAKKRGKEEFAAIGLFLANALREAWEEIRLNPCNVEFLGPLPFRNLVLFTRTIFPLVGHVKKDYTFRPNHEVERVVEIPLAAFFREEFHGTCRINDSANGSASIFETPCIIWKGKDGLEDVLWGATLYIVINFLEIVFDFRFREMCGKRLITRTLDQDYLKGNG